MYSMVYAVGIILDVMWIFFLFYLEWRFLKILRYWVVELIYSVKNCRLEYRGGCCN